MGNKRRAQTSFTYPEEKYDENEFNIFFDHWKGFAIAITTDILKNRKLYYGLDLCKSSAFEGLFKAFLVIKKLDCKEYLHIKGIVRMCVKRVFWSFSRMYGFIRSSGQVFFPISYVDFFEFFKETTIPDKISNIDSSILMKIIENFPEKEREIWSLYINGYNFCEISKKLNYANKSSPLKLHYRSIERIKKMISA